MILLLQIEWSVRVSEQFVGLPDAAVKESRDRVSTALTNSGFKFPMGRTTINLAPADVYLGRAKTILKTRKEIKVKTIEKRRLLHRHTAA